MEIAKKTFAWVVVAQNYWKSLTTLMGGKNHGK